MSLARISAPASHISYSPSKSAFAAHSVEALAYAYTSERKGVRSVRSQSMFPYFLSYQLPILSAFFLQRNRYLVYNLRKRGGDSADKYFKSTEMIAGVKDMRFQALMPDVLHWLGITKIDNMVSMSDMYVPILPTYTKPSRC